MRTAASRSSSAAKTWERLAPGKLTIESHSRPRSVNRFSILYAASNRLSRCLIQMLPVIPTRTRISADAGTDSAELFQVDLGGDVVYCLSFEDAEAISRAAGILDRLDGNPYPRSLVENFSPLLRWYGRHRASRTFDDAPIAEGLTPIDSHFHGINFQFCGRAYWVAKSRPLYRHCSGAGPGVLLGAIYYHKLPRPTRPPRRLVERSLRNAAAPPPIDFGNSLRNVELSQQKKGITPDSCCASLEAAAVILITSHLAYSLLHLPSLRITDVVRVACAGNAGREIRGLTQSEEETMRRLLTTDSARNRRCCNGHGHRARSCPRRAATHGRDCRGGSATSHPRYRTSNRRSRSGHA